MNRVSSVEPLQLHWSSKCSTVTTKARSPLGSNVVLDRISPYRRSTSSIRTVRWCPFGRINFKNLLTKSSRTVINLPPISGTSRTFRYWFFVTLARLRQFSFLYSSSTTQSAGCYSRFDYRKTARGELSCLEVCHRILKSGKNSHFEWEEHLGSFVFIQVSVYSETNLMTTTSLSLVFGSNLAWSEDDQMNTLVNYSLINQLTETLIARYTELFLKWFHWFPQRTFHRFSLRLDTFSSFSQYC